MHEVKPYWQNYIDGKFVDGGAGRLNVDDPGTGGILAEQAIANAEDVDRAVQAAKRVHQSGALSDLRPVERGRMVRACCADLKNLPWVETRGCHMSSHPR